MPDAERPRPGVDRPTKPVEPAPDPAPEKPEPDRFARPGDVLRAYRRKMAEPEQPSEPVDPSKPTPGFAVATRRTRRGHVRAITAEGDWTGTVADAAVFETADAATQLATQLGAGAVVVPLSRLSDDQLDGRPVLYLQASG